MKLLIITQKVDKNDPTLGFFHKWIEELARRFESVVVICLGVGKYNLAKNVKVFSLGKEKGASRLKYLSRFYKYIWKERNNYDLVLVHMNEEYVLLGWKFWKLFGKKIFLWRNHAKGSILTRMAVLFSNKVFYTSPSSFTARFKKSIIMPVGIDTNFFKPDPSIVKKPYSILFLGRISPVKRVEVFVEALKNLKIDFFATIAGAPTIKDLEYEKMIRNKVSSYGLKDRVSFFGAVNQEGALRLYREHELYVNLTPPGSMDKTIFEALSVGLKVLSTNKDLEKISPNVTVVNDNGLAGAIEGALSNSNKGNVSEKYGYSLEDLMNKLEQSLK